MPCRQSMCMLWFSSRIRLQRPSNTQLLEGCRPERCSMFWRRRKIAHMVLSWAVSVFNEEKSGAGWDIHDYKLLWRTASQARKPTIPNPAKAAKSQIPQS